MASPWCGLVGLNPLMITFPLSPTTPFTWFAVTANIGVPGRACSGPTESLQAAGSSAAAKSPARLANFVHSRMIPPPVTHDPCLPNVQTAPTPSSDGGFLPSPCARFKPKEAGPDAEAALGLQVKLRHYAAVVSRDCGAASAPVGDASTHRRGQTHGRGARATGNRALRRRHRGRA